MENAEDRLVAVRTGVLVVLRAVPLVVTLHNFNNFLIFRNESFIIDVKLRLSVIITCDKLFACAVDQVNEGILVKRRVTVHINVGHLSVSVKIDSYIFGTFRKFIERPLAISDSFV